MTKKCAEFRGTESGDKVIQLYVGLLRSYLKIKRKPKSLKVMWSVYEVQYSFCLSFFLLNCLLCFSVYKLVEHSHLLCPQFPPHFLVLYVPPFNPCLSDNKDYFTGLPFPCLIWGAESTGWFSVKLKPQITHVFMEMLPYISRTTDFKQESVTGLLESLVKT